MQHPTTTDPEAREACTAMILAHGTSVYAVCLAILGDPDEATEQAQRTFVTAWRAQGSLRDTDRPGPWLRQIARNHALKALRSDGRRDGYHRQAPPPAAPPDPEAEAARAEDLRLLRVALAALDEVDREVLALTYMDDLPAPEVAERIGASPAAVRKRLQRARERLRDELDGSERSLRRLRPGAAFVAAVLALLSAPAQAKPPARGMPRPLRWAMALAASVLVVGLPLLVALGPGTDPPDRSRGTAAVPAKRVSVVMPEPDVEAEAPVEPPPETAVDLRIDLSLPIHYQGLYHPLDLDEPLDPADWDGLPEDLVSLFRDVMEPRTYRKDWKDMEALSAWLEHPHDPSTDLLALDFLRNRIAAEYLQNDFVFTRVRLYTRPGDARSTDVAVFADLPSLADRVRARHTGSPVSDRLDLAAVKARLAYYPYAFQADGLDLALDLVERSRDPDVLGPALRVLSSALGVRPLTSAEASMVEARASGMPPVVQRDVLGFLVREAFGRDDIPAARRNLAAYRAAVDATCTDPPDDACEGHVDVLRAQGTRLALVGAPAPDDWRDALTHLAWLCWRENDVSFATLDRRTARVQEGAWTAAGPTSHGPPTAPRSASTSPTIRTTRIAIPAGPSAQAPPADRVPAPRSVHEHDRHAVRSLPPGRPRRRARPRGGRSAPRRPGARAQPPREALLHARRARDRRPHVRHPLPGAGAHRGALPGPGP
ncbi:MAG: sigma-70 family RNA polymerase sigma factor [Myxococcales bacterium]|nr:sigma-70 family RNA polymerase sigma factor [Myxococcales bacterium]